MSKDLAYILILLFLLLLFVLGAISFVRIMIRCIKWLIFGNSSRSSGKKQQAKISRQASKGHTPDNRSDSKSRDVASTHTSIAATPKPLESRLRTKQLPSGYGRPVDARPGEQVPIGRMMSECWIPKDGNAHIAGRDIGGMVYVGRAPRTRPGGYPDNAFIDPGLGVSRTGNDHEGIGLHYWPNYSTIDQRSRATYLDWLAGGRSDIRYDIGYVFLYFYGLERRVFVDRTASGEREDIIAEVHRLLEVYGANNSIRRYLNAFIHSANLLDPGYEPRPVFKPGGRDVPPEVQVALGRMAASGVPLDAGWLLSLYLTHPDTRLLMPAKRAFREFKEYFTYLFESELPNGLKLRIPKRNLTLTYHASSGSFKSDLSKDLGEVPDVLSLKVPLSTASAIAEKACKELDKFSRFLGRNPDGRGTIEAHALLPEAIWSMFPCPEKDELKLWVSERIEAGGLVPVEDMFEQLEGKIPGRIGKRQLMDVADALYRFGVGMAPDPRFALRPPRLGEPVVLFDLPEGMQPIEYPTEAYRTAILKLAVGALIAHADERIAQSERDHMVAEIDAMQSVTGAERIHLHANLNWMIAVPPDMNTMRILFRDKSESVRKALGHLAVATAGSDGTIGQVEVRTIEKLYSALGLDRELVYSDIHTLTSTSEPVTVRTGDPATGDYVIPPPREEATTGNIHLDTDRIASVMADTVRVSHVLDQVFSDEEDTLEEIAQEDEVVNTDQFADLDAAHLAVATVLITRKQWTEEEFSKLADEHQLLADGAVEVINEWSYEKFDDALIEFYEEFEVNGEIAHKLMH